MNCFNTSVEEVTYVQTLRPSSTHCIFYTSNIMVRVKRAAIRSHVNVVIVIILMLIFHGSKIIDFLVFFFYTHILQ